jgi:molybdopterin-biosynthesis enzyme MoeA-like protein
MKAMFAVVADEISGEQTYVESVESPEPESQLLDRIVDVQEEFDVTVGSYPGETVRLRVEATDRETVAAATSWLRERVETVEK